MRWIQKALLAIAVILAFAAVTVGFMRMLPSSRHQPEEVVRNLDAYPRAISEPTQAVPEETAEPETTAPPETLPPETEPEQTQPRVIYDAVPLFYMTDYPDIRYRSGTLATSGSNIACLSMVASYLTGNEYRPDELADYFADYIGNSMQWLEFASDALQLPWKKAVDFNEARRALEEGKVVITLLGERSVFTQTQHFIVLTGINEEGRITVNDPFEEHYSHWNLAKGLAEGFENGSIITGYHGSWIYDPAAMPQEPFIYEPQPNTDVFRYPEITLTQEDRDLMAKLICMEAESEPFAGQQAIAEVILNRLAAGNFQSSIKSIIHAEGQFASSNRLYLAEPTHTQYEAIERAYNGPYILPPDVVFFASYKVNDNVWGTIGGHTFCYRE